MKSQALGQVLRAVFLEDLKNKGMALFLALLVWWFAYNNTVEREWITVKVVIVPDDSNQRVLVSQEVVDDQRRHVPFRNTVRLQIEGQRSAINSLVLRSGQYNGHFTAEASSTHPMAASSSER